jgi:hypothetical protein
MKRKELAKKENRELSKICFIFQIFMEKEANHNIELKEAMTMKRIYTKKEGLKLHTHNLK